jgi:hypothetical protein
MNGRQWKDGETVAHFLYYDETGRIVGEVNRAGHQINTKHTTTVYPNASQTLSLGMYINSDTAKAAVEKFWLIQERTLIEHDNTY